jgi:hypothetical protein
MRMRRDDRIDDHSGGQPAMVGFDRRRTTSNTPSIGVAKKWMPVSLLG